MRSSDELLQLAIAAMSRRQLQICQHHFSKELFKCIGYVVHHVALVLQR